MRFEWDEKKNRSNRKKHGLSFELATEVFQDPFSKSVHDESGDEERLWTVGRIGSLVIIVVVHTYLNIDGEEVIRIISARKATPRERNFYEEADE